jgi:(2R)-ethylmalonyl-CoA mutase
VAIADLTAEIADGAWAELDRVLAMGGSPASLDYMKGRLVASLAERLRRIEAGEQVVVGVNRYPESEPSPLLGGMDFSWTERVGQDLEAEQVRSLEAWRGARERATARTALDALRRAAEEGENLVPVSIQAARAGVTTGEWADALRSVFGEYRPPTGITGHGAFATDSGHASLEEARRKVEAAARRRKVTRLRMLMGKPGLDGHSNAAEQMAVRARDAGFEVIYQGIRLTPAEIARAAADEDVHVIGLSILSGAHAILVPDVLARLRAEGVDPRQVPVVVGGIIPNQDARELVALGVARVYTPRDHDLSRIVGEIADLIR